MNTVNVKLYDILRQDFKLSDAKAKEFAAAINEVASESTPITEFKSAIKEDLLKLELKFVSEIKDTKSNLLKWFIGLFITLVLMILGLYAAILLKR